MDRDDELLARWRAGEREAGGALLARWVQPLARFFGSKIGEGIDDLVQETMLACVECRDDIRESSSFRAYLFAVARHRLYDHLRRLDTTKCIDFSTTTMRDLGTSPSSAVARDERRSKLESAMQQISIDHRIAVELAYWEDFQGPELAVVLGIPANTVRSRLARARQSLRRRLDELGLTDLDFGETRSRRAVSR